jgi:hypothetical protein
MLLPLGKYNDFSPAFLKKIEEHILSLGKVVRYQFDISSKNPDPEKINGEVVWPASFTPDPAIFTIQDTDETRAGKSRFKHVAMVISVDKDGEQTRVRRLRVEAYQKGVLTLHPQDNTEDMELAMFLELHPAQNGGLYQDKQKAARFRRIDENRFAKEKRELRSLKLKAATEAQKMSDQEVSDFALGMLWDTTQDIEVLREKVEALAETSPAHFMGKIEGKALKVQALLNEALQKEIIKYSPSESKYSWHGTEEVIAVLTPGGEKNHLEKGADWIEGNGKKGEAVLNKIKGMLKKEAPAQS